ncbi:hypothetical protein O181_061115 [Austropuccinia psidii MF-1]|uniref:Retrotransposon gag domain-containing protein n=1 Tax=Austropuccinia psidii MF-1 TaxID=1389203 RepID=A0A9Q3EEK2_9BASI|nr:hypothetical protein [Austropuccinia psidii MF-1]
MVHIRNGRNYSVQPDGCGQGRVKISFRYGNYSSRKKCLEDARVSPHPPRSVPTNFGIKSEPELIQVNVLRAELFPSGSHRNISVSVQKLVWISQRRGVGNIPKPFKGAYELLLTHQELSGSGEDHRALRRMDLTPFLGENEISAKDVPKLEEWPTFSGKGEYNHIEFIRTIYMLQYYFHIPNEMIVGKLNSLFTRTAKNWYHKMRQDPGKNDWLWWKSEIITKWANNSWRFKMENDFEISIFNSEKDKPFTWFVKQKDRLSNLNPDMSYSMIDMKILSKCGGELEHSIK